MAPVRSALRYGDVREDGRGGFLFQKNFGTMGTLQYVPYDEWVTTIPAYERYRAETARMMGGIPGPKGTDVWRDVVLPKVAASAITRGAFHAAGASGVKGGSRGDITGSSEAIDGGEMGLESAVSSLISKLTGGTKYSEGSTDLPDLSSINSQASAFIKLSREKEADRKRQAQQAELERKRQEQIAANDQYWRDLEANKERDRQREAERLAAEAAAEAERLRQEQLSQVSSMRPPGWDGDWPPPGWEAGFTPPVGTNVTPDPAIQPPPGPTPPVPAVPTPSIPTVTPPVPQPAPTAPPDRRKEYYDNIEKFYGYTESNPGFANPVSATIQTPQAPSTGIPTPQGTSTLSQLPGVGLPSGGQTDSGFIGDVTGLKTKYDTTTDPQYSTSQMDALMASEAYNGTDTEPRAKRLGDYNLIEGLSTPRYAVYHNPENNQSYLSYRGTANLGDATGYWGKIIGGDLTKSERFQDALDIYDQVKEKYGSPPRLVGHSLGGSIVKGVIRERPNAIGVGFNAGSSLFGEDKELGKLCAQQEMPPSVCERFIHHRIEGDIVSMSAQKATTSNRLTTYPNYNIGFNPIAPHLMNQFTDPNSPYWTKNAPMRPWSAFGDINTPIVGGQGILV